MYLTWDKSNFHLFTWKYDPAGKPPHQHANITLLLRCLSIMFGKNINKQHGFSIISQVDLKYRCAIYKWFACVLILPSHLDCYTGQA